MNTPVSVIIPTLQEARNINRVLDALRQQTYAGPLELIVVDGGSTDGTTGMVQTREDVTLVETGKGVAHQRNRGGKMARGELLIFMDADNSPPPEFVASVVSTYRRCPFAVACPWFQAKNDGPLVAGIYFLFNLGFWMGQSTLRMGSGVCIITPRQVFLQSGGYDEELHLGEDIKYLRTAAPRYGLHRHLLVPLQTSGRRFLHVGPLQLLWFYARVTPLLLLGCWKALQKVPYPAAPYEAVAAASGPTR